MDTFSKVQIFTVKESNHPVTILLNLLKVRRLCKQIYNKNWNWKHWFIHFADSEADVESIQTEMKSYLINACDYTRGWTKGNSKQERNIVVG